MTEQETDGDGNARESMIIVAGNGVKVAVRVHNNSSGSLKDDVAPDNISRGNTTRDKKSIIVASSVEGAEVYHEPETNKGADPENHVESKRSSEIAVDDTGALAAFLLDTLSEGTDRIRVGRDNLEATVQRVADREYIPLSEGEENIYRRLSEAMDNCSRELLDRECMPSIDRFVVLVNAGTEFTAIEVNPYMNNIGSESKGLVSYVEEELNGSCTRADAVQCIAHYNNKINPDSIDCGTRKNDGSDGNSRQSLAKFLVSVGDFMLPKKDEVLGIYCRTPDVTSFVSHALEVVQNNRPVECHSIKIMNSMLYLVQYTDE